MTESEILDRIEEKVDGRRYGKYIAARCIFHGDSHASLMIYSDTYNCLACGAFGKTMSLLKRLGCVNPVFKAPIDDGTKHVSNPFWRWTKNDTLENVMKQAWMQFNRFPQTGTYITNVRKIDPSTRKSLGIGVMDAFYTFPIFKGQEMVGAFVRSPVGSDTRYFVPKGQDPNLLYIPFQRMIKDRGVLFVTFGGIDAISVGMCGYASASTIHGKQIDPSVFDPIRKRIIFLPDRGEDNEARRLTNFLGWRGKVAMLPYPDGCKDPNDFFRADVDGLKECLSRLTKKEYC